jgi:peptide deformylase
MVRGRQRFPHRRPLEVVMALREILIWPDKRLTQVSLPVPEVNDDVRALAQDMLDTMYANNGVGLAAPQVGVLLRVVVVDLQGREGAPSDQPPVVMVNPVIVHREGQLTWEEGCLSVPNEVGQVTRASKSTAEYLDLQGKPRRVSGEGLASVALQHEIDHLEGKLFVDYLGMVRRDVIRRRMLRLKSDRESTRTYPASATL